MSRKQRSRTIAGELITFLLRRGFKLFITAGILFLLAHLLLTVSHLLLRRFLLELLDSSGSFFLLRIWQAAPTAVVILTACLSVQENKSITQALGSLKAKPLVLATGLIWAGIIIDNTHPQMITDAALALHSDALPGWNSLIKSLIDFRYFEPAIHASLVLFVLPLSMVLAGFVHHNRWPARGQWTGFMIAVLAIAALDILRGYGYAGMIELLKFITVPPGKAWSEAFTVALQFYHPIGLLWRLGILVLQAGLIALLLTRGFLAYRNPAE